MIEGENVTLKILEERHLEDLRQMRNAADTSMFLTSVLQISEAEQKAWFRGMSLDSSKMYFAVEIKNGDFAGVVRCDEWDKVNRSIRIGVDIAPDHRRQGLATETYRILLPYLFNQLGIHRVWLLVAEFNEPAIALYRKLGFREEGSQREALFRDNRFNDYIMMSLLESDETP